MKNPFDKVRASKWQFATHWNLKTVAVRIETRKVCGFTVVRETHTRKTQNGYGKSKTFFFSR